MTYLTHKWLLILAVMLGLAGGVCENTPATESAGTSPVLHAIPRSSTAETKTQLVIEAESPVPGTETHETVSDQDPMSPDDSDTRIENFGVAIVSYDPKSELDPFMPLIQEKPATPSDTQKSDKPRRILTPLEKMSLSQIRLVAVVMGENFKTSMVEEATGKGYEVRVGTYLGQNGGQVVDIQSDRIIVREKVTDFKGVATERFQELRLHKTDNGE